MTAASKSDKARFFEELYRLNEFESDGEPNEAREFLKTCSKPILSRTSEEPSLIPPRKVLKPFKKVPSIQRSISEPEKIKDVPNATVGSIGKRSGLRGNPQVPAASGSLLGKEASSSAGSADSTNQRPSIEDRRTVSNPVPNTLVLTNSTGIDTMLGKKRKKDTIKLVREADRIFNGFEFFFLRNDDKSPLRKRRITLSREHGAIWTTTWTNKITHLIVDNDLTRKDVLTYLKLNSLPPQVIMVNEEYLSDCFVQRRVMNSLLKKYQVKDPDAGAAKQMAPPPPASENSDSSLQLKAPQSKLSRWGNPPQQETLPRIAQARPASYPQQPVVTGGPEALSPREATTLSDKDGSMVAETQDFGALTEWIQLAKDTEGLPLDNEDEDAVDSVDHSDSDDGGASPLRAPAKRIKRFAIKQGGTNQANFQCMTGGTAASTANPNDYTISVLERLGAYYKRIGDQWRPTAYQKACGMLRKQDHLICTYEEAIEIRTIGHRLAKKIVEIATTGRLRRLESAEADPTDAPLKLFVGIYGVNTTLASEWLRQGHRTLDDLVKNVKLSENQKLGIEHYDDLQQRIPREEVTALGQYIKDAAAALDPDIEIIIGGSYRRGAPTSGDIDIIISKPGTTSTTSLTPFLHSLITHLTSQKFLVAALAVPHDDGTGSKWHGCCVLPSKPRQSQIWRRIDFLLVPASERGAALLYFTGDDIFNRSMRLLANKMGMSLNQRGLYENVMRDRWTRKKVTEGRLVEGREERRIFERLGVPWREPWERVLH
ncbi:hypothetical protein CJF32_00002048 [Rutstroemia sp. NJR-2017a WRK4]|nr:hypothetical protein CJF32_00002048 [Rutstroemia sp. NJR-2017a WRK4]